MTAHDLIRKLDRTLEDNSRVIALNGQAFRQMVASNNRLERSVGEMRVAMDDMRDQVVANTQAILRLIDRLEPPPTAGAA